MVVAKTFKKNGESMKILVFFSILTIYAKVMSFYIYKYRLFQK